MPVPPNAEPALDWNQLNQAGLLEAVMAGVSDGVILIDQDGIVRSTNSVAQEMFDRTAEQSVGQPVSTLFSVDVGRCFAGPERGLTLPDHKDFIAGQERVGYRSDGTDIPLLLNLTPVATELGPVLVAIVRDLSQHSRAEEKIRELALTDPLTGVGNRNLFHIKLRDAFDHAERNEHLVALVLLDLDGFRSVNDGFGHSVGDALLRDVARRLEKVTRKVDTVARLDGDGFAIIVGDLPNPEAVMVLANRVIASLSEVIELDGCLVQTGARLGISFFPIDDTHEDELIRKADLALDEAKRQGRGSCQFYQCEASAEARSAKALEMELRLALVREEFLLHFQPMLDINCRRVVAAEALLRWQHPSRRLVPPGEFIPVAETSDLMVPLGEWVLREACRQNKVWQDAGLPPIRVAVNISARQFQQGDFIPMLRCLLRDTGLDPTWLELEITEGMMMGNTDQVIRTFLQLNQMGVEISIDDFGTGYSSLAYLKRFPVHRLKIDRSFVSDLTTDPDDAAITEVVIKMGHSLNLKVTAEGVETDQQVGYLRGKGCDELQGFLFSKPLPAEEFGQWYRAWIESHSDPKAKVSA